MAYSSGSLTSSMFLILLFSVICFSTYQHAAAASTPPSPSYPSECDYAMIEGTCRNMTYYNLCVTSLESDPESCTGTWPKLPLISLQLSLKNITDTKDYIKKQLLGSSGGGGITTLKHCEESYGLAIQSVEESMKQYHNLRFRNLVKNVNYAKMNVTGCMKEIQKNPPSSSHLTQRVLLSSKLLTVSYDLGKLLVHEHVDG